MNVAQPLIQAGLLGEAIDAGPALVFVADDEMRYVAVNEAACEALGYEREELLDMLVTDVAYEDEASDEYARMVAHGGAAGRARLLCKDGSTFTIEYRAARVTVAQMPLYVSVCFVV